MKTLLYQELVPFYHLLDPLEDHRDEAQAFGDVLLGAVPGAKSLLELGSGAGHGAFFVKKKFQQTTLVDLSPDMLARSREINSDCIHLEGDMRQVRLEKEFDCVLIHDAIAYMVSESDLHEVAKTVWIHLRTGGAALIVPDCLTESFKDSYEDHAGDDQDKSLRCISWCYDPDPNDTTHVTDFAFLLRENDQVRAVHDRHVFGLFSKATWLRVFATAGLEVEVVSRPLADGYAQSPYTNMMFLCRKR